MLSSRDHSADSHRERVPQGAEDFSQALCAGGAAIEGHDGVGEDTGGVLEGFGGVEQEIGLVVGSCVQQVGNAEHVAVEGHVPFKDVAIFGGAADVEGVPGEQPLLNFAFFRMLDGAGGALAERLVHARGQQQADLPADVGGDGVLCGEDRLGDVGGSGQVRALGCV